MSQDHCIICQCEHGMQLSLQLLSRKHMVKAITGHISCIRNISVYHYSCCIGGIPMEGNMSLSRGLRLYQKNRKHTKWKKYTHIFTNISFSWRTGLLPRYKGSRARKRTEPGVTAESLQMADVKLALCVHLYSALNHTLMTATDLFNFSDPTSCPQIGLIKPA